MIATFTGSTASLCYPFLCPFTLWRDTPPMNQTPNADIADYYSAETFKRIKDFADGKETPFVVIDTQTIERQYDELIDGFPYASVYYAVKANPAPRLASSLRGAGTAVGYWKETKDQLSGWSFFRSRSRVKARGRTSTL